MHGEIQRRAVVAGDEHVAHFGGGVATRSQIGQRVEIADALAHLATVHHQVRHVHPVVGKFPVRAAAALRDLVFMMREDEVHAAAVQVKVLAEVFQNHGAALQVPAGAAFAPGAGPVVRAVLGFARFPQGKVGQRVLGIFVAVGGAGGLAGPEAQLAVLQVAEAAVVFEGGNAEVHAAIGGGVGVTAGDELFDHRHLMRDVRHGAGLHVRRQQVQRSAVGVKFLRPALGEVRQRLPRLLRVADGFVVHVGDVAHVQSGGAGGLHHAAHHILRHKGAEVADVRRAVHRGAAAVKAQCFAVERRDIAVGAGEGVVEFQGSGGHGGREGE